jgi:hypothetical protein
MHYQAGTVKNPKVGMDLALSKGVVSRADRKLSQRPKSKAWLRIWAPGNGAASEPEFHGGTYIMRIVAQIEKLGGGEYRFNGKIFDSFLNARREMAQWMKRRRQEQQAPASLSLARMEAVSANA